MTFIPDREKLYTDSEENDLLAKAEAMGIPPEDLVGFHFSELDRLVNVIQ